MGSTMIVLFVCGFFDGNAVLHEVSRRAADQFHFVIVRPCQKRIYKLLAMRPHSLFPFPHIFRPIFSKLFTILCFNIPLPHFLK